MGLGFFFMPSAAKDFWGERVISRTLPDPIPINPTSKPSSSKPVPKVVMIVSDFGPVLRGKGEV